MQTGGAQRVLVVSTTLTVLAFRGTLAPGLLLTLTLPLGCRTALMGPAWPGSNRSWRSVRSWARPRLWGP